MRLPEDLLPALTFGDLELQGQFLPGSNYTFLVAVRYEGQEIRAVYKPMRGEQPLWDFPPASLAGREVAAYRISEALGFRFVPPTILRDGPFGRGSLQQYIDFNPDYHYFTFTPADRQRLRPVAFFDLLVNNADRKGSHVLVQKRTRRLFAIDHGLCFHVQDKLRTVVWDFAGEAFGAHLLSALAAFRANLDGTTGLQAALEEHLTTGEMAALRSRAEALGAAGRFPLPAVERRVIPFPPL